jgi:hypothetical protein
MSSRKPILLSILGSLVLSTSFVPSSWANHRTGHFCLPESIVAGDFNEDGNLDFAVLLTGFDLVAIFIGDGHGGFKLEGHIGVDTLPKGIAVGDVNEDGHLDLVTCSAWGYTGSVLLGDGLGGFTLVDQPDAGGEATRLVLRDFNEDGHLDMAMGAHHDGVVHVFAGDGLGAFGVPTDTGKVPNAYGMAVGDFNHDGHLDVAVARGPAKGAGQVSILLGDGLGGFHLSAFQTTNDPSSLGVADLNGDGTEDLVVAGAQPANTAGNFISTFLGDGAGNFAGHTTIPLGSGNLKGEMAVGDFNEDGHLDVAYPQTGAGVSQGHTVQLFFGDGTGALGTAVPLPVGTEPHSVMTGDFNHDGHLDLAVSNRTDGTISIFLGDGAGHFTLVGTYSVVA